MCEVMKLAGQREYDRILNSHDARLLNLSHGQCVRILMEHGAGQGQAQNGAFVYRLHLGYQVIEERGSRDQYHRLLDDIGADRESARECIEYLENLGFTFNQAKNAVYEYRKGKGLIPEY
jgi:hypothetical protein